MPYLGGNLREEPKSEGMLHTQYGTIFQQEAISHIAHPNKSFLYLFDCDKHTNWLECKFSKTPLRVSAYY